MQSARVLVSDEPPLHAVCASHPSQRASIACPYCGSFACATCTVDTEWGDALCEVCFANGRAQYPLPWEHSVSPLAFVHTAYLVLTDMPALFSALPHGRSGRAVRFALQSALIAGVIALLVAWSFATGPWVEGVPDMRVLLTRSLLVQPLWLVASLLAVAASFHAGATLLGGRAAFACAVRAGCYLSVLAMIDALGKLVDAIAADDSFALLRRFSLLSAVAFCFVRTFTIVGERRYGLTHGRARIVAALAVLVPVLLGGVALALISL